MALSVTYNAEAILAVVKSKVPVWHKDAVDCTLRNRTIFPLMKKWGNLLLGVEISWARIWNMKDKLPETEEWLDNPDQDFPSGPEQKQFSLNPGAYIAKDSLSEQQYEAVLGSKSQIFNLYTEKAVDVQTSMANKLNYAAIRATGTGKNMSGLDTFLTNGTTVAATDIVAKPDDTYAGQDTDVGAEGTWSTNLSTKPNASIATDWPEGQGSPEYDSNAPLLLVRNGPWTNGSVWPANSTQIMRYAASVQRHRGAKIANPSAAMTFLMGERMEREWREFAEARNYRLEPVQEAINIGMPKTLYFEDSWVTQDYDVLPNMSYILQPDMCEFYTGPSYKQIWKMDGPYEFKPEFRHLYACRTIGNFRWQPKFLGSIKDY
jgi:hypothetical protein